MKLNIYRGKFNFKFVFKSLSLSFRQAMDSDKHITKVKFDVDVTKNKLRYYIEIKF